MIYPRTAACGKIGPASRKKRDRAGMSGGWTLSKEFPAPLGDCEVENPKCTATVAAAMSLMLSGRLGREIQKRLERPPSIELCNPPAAPGSSIVSSPAYVLKSRQINARWAFVRTSRSQGGSDVCRVQHAVLLAGAA